MQSNKHFNAFYPQDGVKTSWHRNGTKLRHCQLMYGHLLHVIGYHAQAGVSRDVETRDDTEVRNAC